MFPAQVGAILSRLEQAGFAAYAVGGCVRDTLLGREPEDWDVTTAARPEQTAALFTELAPQAEVNLLSGGQPIYYYLISAE